MVMTIVFLMIGDDDFDDDNVDECCSDGDDDGNGGHWSGLPGWERRKILKQPCLPSKRGARESFIFIITIITI